MSHKVGIYGTGSFAVAIANILAEKNKVRIYSHRMELAEQINTTSFSSNAKVALSIEATADVKCFVDSSEYIFIIVPSKFFEGAVENIAPHVTISHKILHGSKGFFVNWQKPETLSREDIITLSSLLKEKLSTKNIGYIAGPNIAKELHEGKPASILVCSENLGMAEEIAEMMQTTDFFPEISQEMEGAELCSILKNIYAIAVGYAETLGMNAKATIITKALEEIETIFRIFGRSSHQVMQTPAGIGDLIATAFSRDSRNHSLGKKLAAGLTITEILQENKTYEGLQSLKVIEFLARNYQVKLPIVNALYKRVFLREKSRKDFFFDIFL